MTEEVYGWDTVLFNSCDVYKPSYNSNLPKKSFVFIGSVIWKNIPWRSQDGQRYDRIQVDIPVVYLKRLVRVISICVRADW